MGLSHSWIAVQGLQPEQALAALGMEAAETTELHCLPDGIGMVAWPGDWLILVSDDNADIFGGQLTQLATFGPAVECFVEEHVMYSEVRGYADGKGVWRVVHNAERGLFSVQVAGNPPPELKSLMHRKRAHQHAAGGRNAGADHIFDIPPLLARSICGFELGEKEPDSYLQLRPIGSAKHKAETDGPGFFARLFGRGRRAAQASDRMAIDRKGGEFAMSDTEVNYLLVWIAVQGLSPDQALAALTMEYSEEADARDVAGWPDLERRDRNNILMLDDKIFMGRLPQDWLLLFGNLDEDDKARLARLAAFGPAFAGEISRIGCFAEGRAYANGQETWSVDYDFESRGRDDVLEVEGSLPAHLAAIIGEAHALVATGAGRDAGIDILFEVPGKLSKAICGFTPHEPPPEGFRWSMLQPIGGEPQPEPARPGFFARLFGRG